MHYYNYEYMTYSSSNYGWIQMPDLYMTREDLLKLDSAGEIKRNFDKPIKKDTIMMPNGGYVVTRFKAENPGWCYYCIVIIISL